jgi:uncharacterized protein HemY
MPATLALVLLSVKVILLSFTILFNTSSKFNSFSVAKKYRKRKNENYQEYESSLA